MWMNAGQKKGGCGEGPMSSVKHGGPQRNTCTHRRVLGLVVQIEVISQTEGFLILRFRVVTFNWCLYFQIQGCQLQGFGFFRYSCAVFGFRGQKRKEILQGISSIFAAPVSHLRSFKKQQIVGKFHTYQDALHLVCSPHTQTLIYIFAELYSPFASQKHKEIVGWHLLSL